MSRRKQGKPQQRKNTDSVDPDNDLLTCVDCHKEFPLSEILRFIQHKVNRCNKENIQPVTSDCDQHQEKDDDDDDDDSEALSVISSRRTSISAPIARHGTPELRERSSPGPFLSVSSQNALSESMLCDGNETSLPDDQSDVENAQSARRLNFVDTGSNTTHTEPSSFVCVTCKTTCSSAWWLLQHVQDTHGVKIYLDSSVKPVTTPPKASTKSVPATPEPHADREAEKHRELKKIGKKERSEEREKLEKEKETERWKKEPVEQHVHKVKRPGPHTTPPVSMIEVMPHVPPSFLFRMPVGDRQPLSPAALNPAHFNRPPGDFRIDFDPFHHASRMQAMGLLHPGMEPPPAFQNPFDRMRPPPPHAPPSIPLDAITQSQIDFYSQRLRLLAGTSTSPSHSPSPNRKQQTPPFHHNQPSAFTPTSVSSQHTPPSRSLPLEESPSKVVTPPGLPPKLKACEFCGKCFRFQSNLVVHRRSHTGEKPFRCSLCPHACTQASKLKRHMKTHQLKAAASDNSTAETSGTPDSNKHGSMEDLDMEVEEIDEDEEDELDEDEEEEEMDLSEVEPGLMNMADVEQPTDLSQTSQRLNNNDSEKSEVRRSNENEEPTDMSLPLPSNKKDKCSSLLSEVMENTGLKNVAHYSEAFQQALAESLCKNEDDSSENGEKCSENGYKEDGELPKSNSSQDSNYELGKDVNKRIKLEPPDHQLPASEPMYQTTWYPPSVTRDMYMGTMLTPEQLCYQNDVHHNGLSIQESALKLDSPNAGPGLSSLAMSSAMLGQHGKRERLRKDSCEYCGKIFKNCSNLTVHRRSHTGEKPYKCTMCSYACAQSSKLTRHMKTHGRIGKDSYLCKFCNTPFSVPSTLEKHMRKCVENQHGMKLLHDTDEDTCSSSTTASVVLTPNSNSSGALVT